MATGLNNLASLLQDTNRLAEAEPLYRRALAIFETSLGARSTHRWRPPLTISRNCCEPRTAPARPSRCTAARLQSTRRASGRSIRNVAIHLNNLALLLQATNRLAEAEPLYRRALAIVEKSLGPDHPTSVKVRQNLAALLAQLGQTGATEPPKTGS